MNTLPTRLVHPPRIPGEPARATSTPIYQTATFSQDLQGDTSSWDYSRSGNPTRDVLERQLADLDGGSRALAYASGIAAVNATLRLVRPGRAIVTGTDLYGGTHRLLAEHARHLGIVVHATDPSDPDRLAAAITDTTDVVFMETPSNPLLLACDIAAVAEAAHDRGALCAVDNSMLSPYLQRPLELGADLAVQSATKLLGGHGDLTAGVIAVRDPALAGRLAFLQNAEGTALSPFDSWLLLRGLQTLSVRLDRQIHNARRLLALLRAHPTVTRVHSPERGPTGPVISFETGSIEASRRLLAATRLLRITVSFGGVTSSLCLPSSMSHASVPAAQRAAAGLPEDLIRLSTGIEAVTDLEADLTQALAAAAPASVQGRPLAVTVNAAQ